MAEHDASADRPRSDYELLGGAEPVRQVVGRLYELIQADPELAPYFTDIDMAKLRRHQALLISQVLGGPAEYQGRSLREAHEGLNITKDHFGLVVAHLVAALREAGAPEEVIGRVGEVLGGTEPDIVRSTGG